MPEVPIGSRISIKRCMADEDFETATTLVLETSRGARLRLAAGATQAAYDVYEAFDDTSDFVLAHDEEGQAVSLTLSPNYGTPLPAHLFGAGWLRFVGPNAEIIAKAFG
jgi:hypothetical protein